MKDSIPTLSRVNNLHVLCLTIRPLCQCHIHLGAFFLEKEGKKSEFYRKSPNRFHSQWHLFAFLNMGMSRVCQQTVTMEKCCTQTQNQALVFGGEPVQSGRRRSQKSTGDRGSERSRVGGWRMGGGGGADWGVAQIQRRALSHAAHRGESDRSRS